MPQFSEPFREQAYQSAIAAGFCHEVAAACGRLAAKDAELKRTGRALGTELSGKTTRPPSTSTSKGARTFAALTAFSKTYWSQRQGKR